MRPHLHKSFGFELPSWRLLAGTAACATVASLAIALAQPATIEVDGARIVSDVAPVTVGNVAYLPLRAVSEAAGAVTRYNPRTGTLSVRRGTDVLTMKIGDRHARFDGVPITLKNAPFTVHGRTMVRGSDIAMALASAVKYDVARGRIDVRTPGAVVAGVPDDGQ